MSEEKQTVKNPLSKGKAGPGRPKGVPNRTTTLLKDAILQAATNIGGDDGLVGYLEKLHRDNSGAFAGLVGKVLPMQVNHGDADGNKITFTIRDMTKDA